MTIFDKNTFENMFIEFIQHNQSIPSPWGMSEFEEVATDNISVFFAAWFDTKTITTPDFYGDYIDAYICWKDFGHHIVCTKRSFSMIHDGNEQKNYFSNFLVSLIVHHYLHFQKAVALKREKN